MAHEKEQTRLPSSAKPRRRNGTTLFSVRDPQGYEIRLHADRWDNHIVAEHPECKDKLHLVRQTLEAPEVIQREAGSLNSVYYYRLTGQPFYRHKDLYMLVVAHRNDPDKTGFVKTAHLVRRLRSKGGELLWVKRN